MRKFSSWFRIILLLTIAFVIVLFGMATDAHAQEGNPPTTPIPEIIGEHPLRRVNGPGRLPS